MKRLLALAFLVALQACGEPESAVAPLNQNLTVHGQVVGPMAALFAEALASIEDREREALAQDVKLTFPFDTYVSRIGAANAKPGGHRGPEGGRSDWLTPVDLQVAMALFEPETTWSRAQCEDGIVRCRMTGAVVEVSPGPIMRVQGKTLMLVYTKTASSFGVPDEAVYYVWGSARSAGVGVDSINGGR